MSNIIPELVHAANDCIKSVSRAPVIGDLLRGSASRADYARWIIQTYHYVSVTTPLLLEAGAALERSGRYPELAALYREKAREEAGHDRWALRDLAAIQGKTGPAVLPQPSPAVAAYIAWNRCTVETGAPIAFFGTAFVLEALAAACAGRIVERLVEADKIPGIERAVGFLRGHAASDGPHLAALVAALAQIGDPIDRDAVVLSARTTAALYPRFFVVHSSEPAARA